MIGLSCFLEVLHLHMFCRYTTSEGITPSFWTFAAGASEAQPTWEDVCPCDV